MEESTVGFIVGLAAMLVIAPFAIRQALPLWRGVRNRGETRLILKANALILGAAGVGALLFWASTWPDDSTLRIALRSVAFVYWFAMFALWGRFVIRQMLKGPK